MITSLVLSLALTALDIRYALEYGKEQRQYSAVVATHTPITDGVLKGNQLVPKVPIKSVVLNNAGNASFNTSTNVMGIEVSVIADTPVSDLWLRHHDQPDSRSTASYAQYFINTNPDEQSALLAMAKHFSEHRYQFDVTRDRADGDFALGFNGVGYGSCGQDVRAFGQAVAALGIPTQGVWFTGHVGFQAFVDNKWRYIDPNLDLHFIADDGGIASVQELVDQDLYHQQFSNNGLGLNISRSTGWSEARAREVIGSLHDNTTFDIAASNNHFRIDLLSGETITWKVGLSDMVEDRLFIDGFEPDGPYFAPNGVAMFDLMQRITNDYESAFISKVDFSYPVVGAELISLSKAFSTYLTEVSVNGVSVPVNNVHGQVRIDLTPVLDNKVVTNMDLTMLGRTPLNRLSKGIDTMKLIVKFQYSRTAFPSVRKGGNSWVISGSGSFNTKISYIELDN